MLDDNPFRSRNDEHSVRAYNRRYIRDLESYVRTRYPRESFEHHMRDLLDAHPNVARSVIQNYRMSEREKWRAIVSHYVRAETSVTLIIGKKGGFKTTVSWDIARAVHEESGREVVFVGDPDQAPDFSSAVTTFSEAPKGAIVVWDEMAINANARTAMTRDQRGLGGQLAVIRQNKNILLAIVQNLSLSDKSLVTLADDFIIKPLGITQQFTERRGIGPMLKFWRELLPVEDARETLFISKDIHAIKFTRDRPEWLDTSMSEAFSKINTKTEAVRKALKLAEAGIAYKTIAARMEARGWKATDKTWKAWIMAANGGKDPQAPPEEALGGGAEA